MKVYVETYTLQNGDPPYNNKEVSCVYESIEAFEKHKEDHWNGECKWELSQNTIGKAGLDFRTYTMWLKNQHGNTHRYYISIRGEEVISLEGFV